MTPAQFRKIALSLAEAEEHQHMNHPDFRVGGRIFATLGYPAADWAMVKLYPDQQEAFVAADPRTFVPVKGAWGRKGCTNVMLPSANKAKVKEALHAAWRNAAVHVSLKKFAAEPPKQRAGRTRRPAGKV